MKARIVVNLIFAAIFAYVVGYEAIWRWTVCRVYVPEGQSLLVMYKGSLLPFGNPPMAPGDFAKVDENGRPVEIGVLRDMLGPGRHFQYDPLHYKRVAIPDVVIEPGFVGVVKSNLGGDLPSNRILVEGDVGATEHKGILRKVLKPGRYRINLYGYDVSIFDGSGVAVNVIKLDPQSGQVRATQTESKPVDVAQRQKRSGWVRIEPGYVGVVTNLTDHPEEGLQKGIQTAVLQPGIYAINPREQQVDIVEIGYQEVSVAADLSRDQRGQVLLDENGEPVPSKSGNSGINFPSSDGFPITIDFTGIWGIMPDQASKVVELYGSVTDIEKNVIAPEIESICRIHGSSMKAMELLTGDTREIFQRGVSEDFGKTLKGKNISLEVGLVRHIYIPAEVRGPLQKANIADELKLTRDMEIETTKIEGSLEEAKANVKLEEKRVTSETEKLYQEQMALGRKEVEEIKAETEKLVAAIAKETAEIEAQSTIVLGEAEAQVEKLKQEAMSQKFELAVKAFGSPEAYNNWVFAEGLPDDLRLVMMYAGQGTFWTDLKGFQDAALGKMLKDQVTGEAPPRTSTGLSVPSRPGN